MRHKGDILIVDDETVVLQGARKILAAEGLKVDTVPGADAAIARLRDNGYRLILSDLMLPGMDGIDLMLALRRRRHHAPVIIVTGFATLDRAIESFRNGSFDFLPKPFDAEELLGVVQRGLSYSGLGPSVDPRSQPPSAEQAYGLGQHTSVELGLDGRARVRLGSTFADLGSDLVSITLPEPGDEIRQVNECARITTEGGAVHRVWAPLSGRILEVTRTPAPGPRRLDGTPLFDMQTQDPEQELGNLTRGSQLRSGADLPKEATW